MLLGGGWKVTLAEFNGLDILFHIPGGMFDELPKGFGKGINRFSKSIVRVNEGKILRGDFLVIRDIIYLV